MTEDFRKPLVPRHNLVQSVVRSLDVLELIGSSHDGLSVQSVSRCLKLPPSTAYDLLKTLAHRGYLERVDKPIRYRLGEALGVLRRRQSDRDILTRAVPRLFHIARQAECETILGEYIGGEILGILRIPLGEAKVLTMPPTWNLSPYGSGLVFQAFLPEGIVREYRSRHPLSQYNTGNWASLKSVDDCINRIRRDGYLRIDRGETFRAVAPVFTSRRSIRAIVIALLARAIATPSQKKTALRLVRQSASELSSPLQA